ncbi:hypothetical protein NtRootA1_25780 [Arthrobacter sp. NtRootA1]|nr:hypothetical protein NtRootA1_25780 [Arthrobacter sp. NtRootA1]
MARPMPLLPPVMRTLRPVDTVSDILSLQVLRHGCAAVKRGFPASILSGTCSNPRVTGLSRGLGAYRLGERIERSLWSVMIQL